jgi:hypothetical protein
MQDTSISKYGVIYVQKGRVRELLKYNLAMLNVKNTTDELTVSN